MTAISGALSAPIALGAGDTVIAVRVQAPEGLVRTYDITVSRTAPASQRIYGKASNAEQFDQFGWSVALSGDVLVVGAPFEDSNARGVNGDQISNSADAAGAAYVFRRTGGVWAQEAYLKASNTFNGGNGNGDNFGLGVAVSGDTVAVSAYHEDSSATGIDGDQSSNAAADSGAVYVFRRTGGVWGQEAYVKASNTEAGDELGYAVALSGDTLAVGARREASSATGVNGDDASNDAAASGAVYVYTRTGTTWARQAYVKASNTGAADEFGATLTLAGDLLAVGAQNEDCSSAGVNGSQLDNLASNSGAAYVFRRAGSTWTQEAYVKASNTGATDGFGSSLAIEGEILVVGARNEDSSATGVGGNQGSEGAADSGAAYVFRHDGTRWVQVAYVKSANTGANDAFGTSVAVSRDGLAVGSKDEASNASGIGGDGSNNLAPSSGAAYVFH